MAERRKANFKQGVRGGEISDRMKHQSIVIRKGKRGELTKRFRSSNEAIPMEAFSEAALLSTALAIKSLDRTVALSGVSKLRALMSCEDKDPPIQAVLNAGVMSDLIRILSCNDDVLISEAIWCITNIATGNHDQTGAAIHAIPALLNILCSPARPGLLSLQEQVCGAIGNIAGDSDEYRSALLQIGVLQPLVDFLLHLTHYLQAVDENSESSESIYVRNKQYASSSCTAAWALSNISRGSTTADVFLNSGVTRPLIDVLRRGTSTIVPSALHTEICWLFTFLAAKVDVSVAALIEQGLIPAMVYVATASDPSSVDTIPCIRTLVNLSSGPVEWVDLFVQESTLLGILIALCDISKAHKSVAMESLWLLSNLLGGGPRHRGAILSCKHTADILQNIVKAILSDQFELQRESLFALHHACLDKNDIIYSAFGGSEVIGQILQLLKAPDVKVSMTCMQVLRILAMQPRVLSICADLGLHDILDDIQYGPGDDEIRQVARVLAEDLFEKEDDEEIEASAGGFGLPPVPGTGFGFGPQTGAGDGGRGMGRGSHLIRPAWMLPN